MRSLTYAPRFSSCPLAVMDNAGRTTHFTLEWLTMLPKFTSLEAYSPRFALQQHRHPPTTTTTEGTSTSVRALAANQCHG